MSDPQLQPTPSRSLDDWTALIAAGALVAGGFLVSIAGPMLRKLYDARRDELAGARLVIDEQAARLAELAPPELAAEPGGQAADVETSPPDPHDVWTRATGNGSADYASEPIGTGDGS